MDLNDNPSRVREGEELDVASVETFLSENVEGLRGPIVIE